MMPDQKGNFYRQKKSQSSSSKSNRGLKKYLTGHAHEPKKALDAASCALP